MKFFISMPMSGLPANQVELVMDTLHTQLEQEEDTAWISTLIDDYTFDHPLKHLGESIKRMAEADEVHFVDIVDLGDNYYFWTKARDCVVEWQAAKRYAKRCYYWLAKQKDDDKCELVDVTEWYECAYPLH